MLKEKWRSNRLCSGNSKELLLVVGGTRARVGVDGKVENHCQRGKQTVDGEEADRNQ
jgi:hypothetical protein